MTRPRYVQHRTFSRLQHSTRFLEWLDEQAERLDTTAKFIFEELLIALRFTFEQVEQVAELVEPENTAAPVVTGHAVVGETLTVTAGEWDGFPTPVLTYQWVKVDEVEPEAIQGATGQTFVPGPECEGCIVYVTEIAISPLATKTKDSAPTTEILGPAAPVNTKVPEISGTAKVGELLEVVAGEWSGAPEPELTYQWVRNDGETDTVIEGVEGDSYTLTAEDEGFQIFVREFANNSSGSEVEESVPTAAVEAEEE